MAPARERLDRRAGRLLELARTAVPFVAGLIASRNPANGSYSVVSGFGYRAEIERYLLTEFVAHDPGFSAVVDHPESTLFWSDVPDFGNSITARNVLLPGGFREGTSIVLCHTGDPLGVVHLSLATPAVPAHARAFLTALREELTDVVAEAKQYARDDEARTTQPLTDRELDVLRLMAVGLTNHQIARRLEVSPSTVGTHLERIHTKLDVTSRVAAATTALRRGLID